jgi:hypothetical protein
MNECQHAPVSRKRDTDPHSKEIGADVGPRRTENGIGSATRFVVD